jgi:hypothetical protein
VIPDETEKRFRELFRELAIAARAIASYPSGHPVLVAGLDRATKSIRELLEGSGPIELVAARDGFVLGDRRFTEPSPARLAALVRRRRAAALSFVPGVTRDELERVLRAIALEPRLARGAGSLAQELAEADLRHVAAIDLDFSGLVLVEGDTAEAEEDLWVRIAQRLIGLGDLDPERIESWLASGGSMANLLRSLLGRDSSGPLVAGAPEGGALAPGPGPGGSPGGAAGASAGAGGTLGERLAGAAVAAFAENPEASVGPLVEVVGWLSPDSRLGLVRELQRALTLQADGGKRLAAFFAALPPEEGARLGEGARTGLLAPPPVSPTGDPARIARLRRMLADADIDVVLTEARGGGATDVLLELAGAEAPPPESLPLGSELEPGGIARAVASSLLELAERDETTEGALVSLLAKVDGAYRSLLVSGRLRQALGLVERIQHRSRRDDPMAPHFRRAAERLSAREALVSLSRALAELPPEGITIARQLVERLGSTGARHLIGLLAESEDRDQRRRLLDLLAGLGPLVVRDATHLLGDPRWYVVRNVLLLLRRVGDPGSLPAIRKCAEHPDLRVRLEAIRNLFAFDSELPRELLRQAFHHKDPRLAGEAIDLAAEHRMSEAGELLVELLARWDPLGSRKPVRLKAIRALAEIGDAALLAGLPRYGARFQLLPVSKEEQVAFYKSLPSYPRDAIGAWVALGLRSPLDEVRRLATALDRREGDE